MEKALRLEIATPDKLVLSEDVEFVTACGGLGEFTVLPGHTPLLTTIVPGLVIFGSGADRKALAVGWGYAEVRPYKVIILVEFAVTKDEIDADELEKEIDEVIEKINSASSYEEKESLIKQLERLKAKKKLLTAA